MGHMSDKEVIMGAGISLGLPVNNSSLTLQHEMTCNREQSIVLNCTAQKKQWPLIQPMLLCFCFVFL